jgi:uncharacterized phage protein (TIGR01671 family)
MREIKFRAWSHKCQVLIPNVSTGTIYVFGDKGDSYEAADCELMQFTGLHDRNGNEVYEGDIVAMFQGSQFSIVFWDEGFGAWSVTARLSGATKLADHLLGNMLDTIEVVGNVYQNPELLN